MNGARKEKLELLDWLWNLGIGWKGRRNLFTGLAAIGEGATNPPPHG